MKRITCIINFFFAIIFFLTSCSNLESKKLFLYSWGNDLSFHDDVQLCVETSSLWKKDDNINLKIGIGRVGERCSTGKLSIASEGLEFYNNNNNIFLGKDELTIEYNDFNDKKYVCKHKITNEPSNWYEIYYFENIVFKISNTYEEDKIYEIKIILSGNVDKEYIDKSRIETLTTWVFLKYKVTNGKIILFWN